MSPRHSVHSNGGSGNEGGPSRQTSIHIQAPLSPREERFNANMSLNMVGPYPSTEPVPQPQAQHRQRPRGNANGNGRPPPPHRATMPGGFEPVPEDHVSQRRSMIESVNTDGQLAVSICYD